ncbi:MAG TPA: type II toxin-antitoxin system VapC family toxin [Acidobacteriaceae bacterium]
MGDGALIVLDTRVALWSLGDSPRLSANARRAIGQARRVGSLHIASMALLEVARLVAAQRLGTTVTLDVLLDRIENSFMILPITAAVAAATTRLPASYPRDPADRIIGATALVHGAALVTADEGIRKAKAVRTIW